MPSHNIPFWHGDYFMLITLRNCRLPEETLWKQSWLCLLLSEICIYKFPFRRGPIGRELLPEITFLPERLTCRTATYNCSSQLPKNCFPPPQSPRPLSLSLTQNSIWTSIFWPHFEFHIFVRFPYICK